MGRELSTPKRRGTTRPPRTPSQRQPVLGARREERHRPRGTGPRAPGAGRGRREALAFAELPPDRGGRAPPSPRRPLSHTKCTAEPEVGRRAAADARPVAGGMDSDSGEQSEGDPVTAAGPDVFSSKNLALQAQKKILSKIASKTVANMLIDDTSSEIFDELYKVTKEHTHNKKEAHKIMKDLIKVAIKIGILYRNNQFNQEEIVIVEKFRKKLNQTAMTIVSFYEVEYTFDRNVLSKLLHECKDLVHELVQRHLTPRTHGRINHVFNHFADVEFLSTLYSLDGDCRPNLKRICEGINTLIDEKVL
ncbi:tumor necrosis factor alpha-induced protein 8-like protein 3 [Orycteropus afer afer]|uniref:Tumor necrosis factor alpha-induced protein 8-like protein 3 n=1 Tax=Orycteropus afer afer TaxID=1230840 RepID=A0A8B6ZHH2_ORYAF|nr:tumor necrosis factor alpha-induced protein 8-like protein 3 [Orycteropus afer afer]